MAIKTAQVAHQAISTCAPLSGRPNNLGQIQSSDLLNTNHSKTRTGCIHKPYVLPAIATRCLWICLTWPPSWFRGRGFPRWTRVSTPSCTWPNAATAPTAAAAMTQTKQMEGWGKDGQRLQSTEDKQKSTITQIYVTKNKAVLILHKF